MAKKKIKSLSTLTQNFQLGQRQDTEGSQFRTRSARWEDEEEEKRWVLHFRRE